MKRVHILGVGSPFGMDRLGWLAIDVLRESGVTEQFPPGMITLDTCDQPGSLLLAQLKTAGLVILIDAIQCGKPAGCILRLDEEQLQETGSPLSSHGFSVAEALKLGRALGELPQKVLLYGIEGGGRNADPEALIGKIGPELVSRVMSEVQN